MSDKNDNKVLPMDKWRQDKSDNRGLDLEDSSLGPLLEHMRKVREAVPVNVQLKEELRKKLFHQKADLLPIPSGEPKSSNVFINRWFSIGLVVILMAVISLFLWHQVGLVKKLDTVGELQELTRYWAEEKPLSPAISPDGKNLLVTRGGSLLWLDESGTQYTLLKSEQGEYYHSPTWTPDGKNITLVKKTREGNDVLIQYPVPFLSMNTEVVSFPPDGLAKETPELLYRGREGEEISNLHWSPKENYLAYVLKKPQKPSVIMLLDSSKKLRNLGPGINITWSPDGTKLVVARQQKEPQLWLVSLEQQEEFLGNGENPVWSPQGYLVFTEMKTQERILTYMPDGLPQYTVQQRVGEIRSVYLGENGKEALQLIQEGKSLAAQSNLLISINNEKSLTELEWLRKLEAEGVREPRMLLLDEVEQIASRCFGPQGQSLYLTKESGGLVSILRIKLQERFERRGD
ncbi:PD40 domain-containing protein [Desulfolucanica intricata]|uniref:PD40 domain-containing protein n=1 Tax=Desulfolucanica intricata TaxID=1285191 RepID=UPI000836DD13|nr:PD40 domain-containing protein [Desulfolucanica intricata]